MRLGIFGGTFDPIHLGHLLLAEMCREQCSLDKVWFLPAGVPPHKQEVGPQATTDQRIAMVELAIGGHAAFEVCDYEAQRGGVNYTYATLEWISQQRPGDELFFLMGADSLADLPSWRNPERICELAVPVVVDRPAAPAPNWNLLAKLVSPERLNVFREYPVEMPVFGISSTEIRRRVAAGLSIRYQTPRAVEKFIEAEGIYQATGTHVSTSQWRSLDPRD